MGFSGEAVNIGNGPDAAPAVTYVAGLDRRRFGPVHGSHLLEGTRI
jgi:hypothetical protein